MLQGETQSQFDQPVLVAGVWHYINITLDQPVDDLLLRFYKGTVPVTQSRNETNYYEWHYARNGPVVWTDTSGYGTEYLQQNLCKNQNTLYSFCVGIKDTLPDMVDYAENWTVDVSHGGQVISSQGIVVEKPRTGVSLSKPSSIIFHVDPFTLMDAQGDTFFKIGNVGNLPLYVRSLSSRYDYIEIGDINKKVLPGEVISHYVTVHSLSWPPGIKRIDMQLNGSYPQSYFIDTNATVTLYSSFIIDVPQLIIYVGHSNYRIDEIQGTGITFQYLEKITMSEGEVRSINAYVSGDGPVTVEIWADEKNVSAITFYDGDTETHSPISFTSTNTSERAIVVTVRALRERTTGILSYKLTSNGETKTYTTLITVGPPASKPSETVGSPVTIVQIVIILAVILVVVYMILSYIRKRAR